MGFALLALAEYRNITFMRILTGCLFIGYKLRERVYSRVIFALYIVVISYFIVWVRGVVPRFRYDLLIGLC